MPRITLLQRMQTYILQIRLGIHHRKHFLITLALYLFPNQRSISRFSFSHFLVHISKLMRCMEILNWLIFRWQSETNISVGDITEL